MATPTLPARGDAAVDGRRERNRRRTRAAIIAASLTLVDRWGYDAVTIEMIADTADVSARTFSNYFAGKEEAFFASEPEPGDAIRAAFASQPAELSLLPALRSVLGELATDISSRAASMDVRLAALQAQPRLAPAFKARFGQVERVLTEQIALRLDVDPETDRRPRLLAGVMVSLIHGSLVHWRAGDRLEDLPSIVTTSFDVLVQAFAPSPPEDPHARSL